MRRDNRLLVNRDGVPEGKRFPSRTDTEAVLAEESFKKCSLLSALTMTLTPQVQDTLECVSMCFVMHITVCRTYNLHMTYGVVCKHKCLCPGLSDDKTTAVICCHTVNGMGPQSGNKPKASGHCSLCFSVFSADESSLRGENALDNCTTARSARL